MSSRRDELAWRDRVADVFHSIMPRNAPHTSLPRPLIIAVLVVIAVPEILYALGVELGTPIQPATALPTASAAEAMHDALRGSIIHVFLEWTAVSVAAFTATLALIYARYTDDHVAPILALALCASGWIDVFHTLAATYVIGGSSDPTKFIPFTWAMSRIFHAAVLLVGVTIVLWQPHLTSARDRWRRLLVVGLAFASVAYALIHICANSPVLPRTLYPDATISRPYDLVPLVLSLIVGGGLLPRLYRRYPSPFTQALWLAILPDVITDLHMAFGSDALFDGHFHMAHFTKVIAYAVPLCGLVLEYAYAHRNLADNKQHLEELTTTLEERAGELERANDELKQFAYVASHDLRAPLRAIDNLSQWLQDDLDERLTGEDRKHLELLRGRVKRMDALLEALLQYSRVGRRDAAIERVDVRALLDDIVDLHAPPAGFQITIAPDMPALETDRTALQQVFANLIGNALKHHDRDSGHIAIGCEDRGDCYAFTVRDDGPGIPPAFHTKVFEMFQTLKRRDEVEGSGMGLALVKKQVDSWGGRIVLHSTGERGTTFEFTWPKRGPRRGTS
jgi:signal transduction histidine kinase